MLTWYVCDLKTGVVLNTLPLTADADIERTVGAASTLAVKLAVRDEKCPADWEGLLDKRRTMLVLDDGGRPLVGYRIAKPIIGGPEVLISLESLESIPNHVFCRTHDFYEAEDDEADVAAALLNDVVVPSFGFVLDVTQTGKTADHSYAFEEDRTVGSALTDLMGADGGPEWTIRLAWEDDETRKRIVKTIQIGPRIGHMLPSVIFENRHLASRERISSANGDDLATHVIATSDGSGPDRPMSVPHVDQDAIDAGVPQWEARVHVTGVDEPEQLNRVALAGLQRRWNGVTTWELELQLTEPSAPRVGWDFDAGDTPTIDSGPMRDDPASWRAEARIIGWRAQIAGRSFRTVTPVFWDEKEVGAA